MRHRSNSPPAYITTADPADCRVRDGTVIAVFRPALVPWATVVPIGLLKLNPDHSDTDQLGVMGVAKEKLTVVGSPVCQT